MMADAASPAHIKPAKTFDGYEVLISGLTVLGALFWLFPIYWALITSFKPEDEVVQPGIRLWPEHFTFDNYTFVLFNSKIALWYFNSMVTSGAVTILVVLMSAAAGYAISQLKFPGRRALWWMIVASFMVPIPALIINHFVLMSQF